MPNVRNLLRERPQAVHDREPINVRIHWNNPGDRYISIHQFDILPHVDRRSLVPSR